MKWFFAPEADIWRIAQDLLKYQFGLSSDEEESALIYGETTYYDTEDLSFYNNDITYYYLNFFPNLI